MTGQTSEPLDLKAEIAELKHLVDFRSEIGALRQEITNANRQSELQDLRKALDYQKELATFRAETALQLSFFKWAAWTLGVGIAVLGFLGIKGWNDLTKSAETLMSKQLNEMSDRYSNLSRGFSLQDSGRSQQALPYLLPLYEANRYDEPVIRALFEAFDNVGDCDSVMARFAEVRSDKSKFEKIKDPAVFNTLGFTLRNCYDENKEALVNAKQMVETSLRRFAGNDPLRRYPLFNLFSISFIENDLAKAKNYLENASTIEEGYPGDIDGVKTEVWFKKLKSRRPGAEKEMKVMWDSAMQLQRQILRKPDSNTSR